MCVGEGGWGGVVTGSISLLKDTKTLSAGVAMVSAKLNINKKLNKE